MRNLTATPGLIAIACLLPVSSWWFMQMLVLPASTGTGASSASMQALRALVLLQFLSVSLFGPQVTTKLQHESGRRIALLELGTPTAAFVLPAWPLLAMLLLASGLSAGEFAAAEAGVAVVGLAVMLLARGLRYFRLSAETKRMAQVFLGLVAACSVWLFRQELLRWIGL